MRCLVLSLYRYAFASSKLSTNSVTLVNGLLFPTFLNCSLCCGEAGDGNAEGRAGYVVEADLVAELNGNGVTAVLTADTAVHLGTNLLAQEIGRAHV